MRLEEWRFRKWRGVPLKPRMDVVEDILPRYDVNTMSYSWHRAGLTRRGRPRVQVLPDNRVFVGLKYPLWQRIWDKIYDWWYWR